MAQVMAPIVVTSKEQIPTLNYIYFGMTLLGELATLVTVTRWVNEGRMRDDKNEYRAVRLFISHGIFICGRSRPPTPPSRSAEHGTTIRASYLQQLKATFTSLPFLGLLIMTGIVTGLYLLLNTVSQQMLCSKGYSDVSINQHCHFSYIKDTNVTVFGNMTSTKYRLQEDNS